MVFGDSFFHLPPHYQNVVGGFGSSLSPLAGFIFLFDERETCLISSSLIQEGSKALSSSLSGSFSFSLVGEKERRLLPSFLSGVFFSSYIYLVCGEEMSTCTPLLLLH